MRRRERFDDGDLHEERLAGGRVRGSVVSAHIAWVQTYGSPTDVAAIGLEMRRIGTFLAADWLPFGLLNAIDKAIVNRFQSTAGEGEVMEDVGRFTARTLLPANFRAWEAEDHQRFLADLVAFEEDLFDFARFTIRLSGARSVSIIRTTTSSFSRLSCAAAAGFYEQSLLMRGALRPVVSEETCTCLGWPFCKFLIRWR